MTTIEIKTNTITLKGSFLKGIESMNFKMVSILFIVVLNLGTFSAQSNHLVCTTGKLSLTKHEPLKNAFIGPKYKVYTVFLAKTFPVLEGTTNSLNFMEESELENYDMLDNILADETFDLLPKVLEVSKVKIVSKNQKNKIAQKLNS